MYCCQSCGYLLERLQKGGCGGYRAIYGCPMCDKLFEQTTGGIVATPGGKTLRPIPGGSYKKFKKEKSCLP